MKVVLTINVGSSTLKFAIFQADSTLKKVCSGAIDENKQSLSLYDSQSKLVSSEIRKGAADLMRPRILKEWLLNHYPHLQIAAIGHRVVHGGKSFLKPTVVTKSVLAKLKSLTYLAPLHLPTEVNFIGSVFEEYPTIKQVACFDTSFHSTQPRLAKLFAIPRKYTCDGVIRYGFHGLSYEYIAQTIRHLVPAIKRNRVVAAHLGNGSSACAMLNGKSIATTMGFTALDGLVMGTRCGAIDAGVILFLMQEKGMSAKDIERMVYKESGLLGVSGISGDVRTLLASKKTSAIEAIELFCYRAAREVGSLVAALKGLDMIVFTGGIGEKAVLVRELICKQLSWLGIELSASKNRQNASIITTNTSKVEVRIIEANEELTIAKQVLSQIKKR